MLDIHKIITDGLGTLFNYGLKTPHSLGANNFTIWITSADEASYTNDAFMIENCRNLTKLKLPVTKYSSRQCNNLSQCETVWSLNNFDVPDYIWHANYDFFCDSKDIMFPYMDNCAIIVHDVLSFANRAFLLIPCDLNVAYTKFICFGTYSLNRTNNIATQL